MGSSVQRYARIGHLISARVVAFGIALQTFWAGFAILVKVGQWSPHVTFAHYLFYPILLVPLCALLGRMERRLVWQSLLLVLLYVLQFVLIYVPQQFGADVLRALHPVNALAMMVLTANLARRPSAD
jgi:glycopeptide antibiotics resistance protein